MGWQIKGSPQTVLVNRDLAQEWADMEPAPQDRPLSERRLQVYRRFLVENKFRPCTWARAWCLETQGWYRVNGKHTSTLLSSWQGNLPTFYAVIEDYVCERLSDVADLYGTFDSKIQSRTVREINQAFAGTVKELEGISPGVINMAVSGMSFHLGGASWKGHEEQPLERAERLLEYPEFVVWMSELGLASSMQKNLLRRASVAAMFATWLRDAEEAMDFWTAVRDETGSEPNMPDRRVAKYLSVVKVATEAGPDRPGSPREIYAKCLHGWNAWRRKQTTALKYYSDKPVPEAL